MAQHPARNSLHNNTNDGNVSGSFIGQPSTADQLNRSGLSNTPLMSPANQPTNDDLQSHHASFISQSNA